MAKESFLRGAVILALASGASRIVGIVYMVVLPRIIRDDGMGLLQLVKPIYYFAAVLAISGMPVAISKLVAEKAAQGSVGGVARVFRISLAVMVLTGSLAALGMYGSARFFADVIAKDEGVYLTTVVLAPATFFLAISGALRGFFQGLQHMTPTAVSQVADQVIRVVTTIGCAVLLLPRGVEYGAAGAAVGSVVGECVSVLVLLGFFVSQRRQLYGEIGGRRHDRESTSSLLRRLGGLAFPVVVATILWPVMQMLDTLLVPTRMQHAGFSSQEIRDWIGYLGMALTVSQFPNIVTVALATSLVPAISEAAAIGRRQLVSRRTEEAIRVSVIFGLPSVMGLYVLARPISEMLFGYAEVGIPLRVLALGTITLGLIQATTGVLQGLGLVMIPVRHLLAGVVLKFVVSYHLTGLPDFGVLGAAWGTTLGWLLVALLNLYAVFRRVGASVLLGDFVVKPALACLITAATAFYGHGWAYPAAASLLGPAVGNAIATLSVIAFSMGLYFIALMLSGTIRRKDISLVPRYGKRLAQWLYGWGVLRR